MCVCAPMWTHTELLTCVQLFDPIDYSLPGSSVCGIFQQEYWSGLSFPTPGDLPNPETEPESLVSPALAGEFLTIAPPRKPHRQAIPTIFQLREKHTINHVPNTVKASLGFSNSNEA